MNAAKNTRADAAKNNVIFFLTYLQTLCIITLKVELHTHKSRVTHLLLLEATNLSVTTQNCI